MSRDEQSTLRDRGMYADAYAVCVQDRERQKDDIVRLRLSLSAARENRDTLIGLAITMIPRRKHDQFIERVRGLGL